MQNFGKLKNAFNDILVEGIYGKNKDKTKLFRKYIKTIKENEILRTQFQIYRNIETKVESNELKATQYVKENIELLKKFNKKAIKEANDMLSKISKGINISDVYKLSNIHEDIHLLVFTKKTTKNIDSIVESTNNIVSFIKENTIKEDVDDNIIPSNIIADLSVEKFNEKYSDISEGEKDVLRTLIESDENGKKEVLKNTIKECIDIIDDNLIESDLDTKDRLLKVKDKLLRMDYIKESFIADIGKVFELKSDLEG